MRSVQGLLRVLDLGIITAGAAMSQVLGDLGADGIKIEAPSRPDFFRRWTVSTARRLLEGHVLASRERRRPFLDIPKSQKAIA